MVDTDDADDKGEVDKQDGSEEIAATSEPPPQSVLDYLLYGASLPERALRGTSAVVAGTLRESANLLLDVIPHLVQTKVL